MVMVDEELKINWVIKRINCNGCFKGKILEHVLNVFIPHIFHIMCGYHDFPNTPKSWFCGMRKLVVHGILRISLYMFVLSMSCTWQFTSIRNEFSRWTWIRYIFLLLNVIEVQAWRKYKDLCMWIRMKSGRDKSTQKARRLFAWCFFLGMLPPAPAPYPHIGTQIRKFHFLWG